MSSPKRERRTPSPDGKSDRRMPDVVSTRRESDFHSSRSRGYQGSRPRRPYGGGPRRQRGRSIFRSFSERYYPNRVRYESGGNRRQSHSSHRHHSRSRSSGRSYSRSRSRSHTPRRRRSRSASGGRRRRSGSSSGSSSSASYQRHKHNSGKSAIKPVKLSHLRHEGSRSPQKELPLKKKPRPARSESDEKSPPRKKRADSEDRGRSPAGHLRRTSSREEDRSKQQDRYRSDESGQRSRDSRHVSPRASSSSSKKHASEKKHLIARNRLHDIFTLITHDESFQLEEDISIAIQRNPYAEPSEESTVRKVFDAEMFAMIRNLNEGLKPIFDREEINKFGHDSNLADDPDFERRVIRLKPGKSSQDSSEPGPSTSVQRFKSAHSITRMIQRDRRSKSRSRSRSRSGTSSHRREPEVRLKMRPDPRYEAKYKDLERKDGSGSRKLHPDDLRHELRGSGTKATGDLRNRLDKRDETPWLSRKDESVRKDNNDAPDYSRRKDKYKYAEWMDKPEMIPKNPLYFETVYADLQHDNRDERDLRDRGRGRGFRGRFMSRRPYRPWRGRGSFRGRPYISSSSSYNDRRSPPSHSRSRYEEKRVEGEWKHDKFAELEGNSKSHKEDDQHPHSTSER